MNVFVKYTIVAAIAIVIVLMLLEVASAGHIFAAGFGGAMAIVWVCGGLAGDKKWKE